MHTESIKTLKGIGDKTAALFHKLDIDTIDDLLHYYPRGYDICQAPVPIRDVRPDTLVAVEGMICRSVELKKTPRTVMVVSEVKDTSGSLQLVWYNMAFLKNTLKFGARYVFRGKIGYKNRRPAMEQPDMFTLAAYDEKLNSMQPVYGQTKGLTNNAILKAVAQSLEQCGMARDYMPEEIRRRRKLAEYNFAISHIHFPKDKQDLLFARRRLVFDEFFFFMMTVQRLKEGSGEQKSCYCLKPSPEVSRFEASLPYALTGAQKRALGDITADMESGLVMNRLVQGDVGSGKTILAVLALLQAVCNGFQGAMMAPTEVLAKQHYDNISRLFEAHGVDKQPVLLTGSMTAREKREAYEKITSHQADIIIGTHAIIQDKVIYDNLALVITDEQHRFGVRQREALGDKGRAPHVLVMSATPIPRTLAIILYGDLDISVIDELPANRLPIKNCVVDTNYRPKAYQFIASQVAADHQAYVICPMVEESEMLDAENVIDYTKTLREQLPPGITVEYLHGKMKPKEKNEIMERFAANQIQVLVSTTVVEVGVDVPNATVIMIENAERFGLAQLHQLRGRVGRGRAQSYCIMVNTGDNKETKKRLEVLNKSNDGFFIASEDLKLRGPGDIFGIRQSGLMEFKVGDIYTDADLLKEVSEEVGRLMKEDPELALEENGELKKYMDAYLEKSYASLCL